MRTRIVSSQELSARDLRASSYVAPALRAVCVCRRYCVEVTREEMIEILRRDDEVEREQMLDRLLGDAGAKDVEYDGHFGAAVWFSLDADDDKPALRRKLVDVIAGYCGRRT